MLQRLFILLILTLSFLTTLRGQTPTVIAEWSFHPNYQLQGNAANQPGPRLANPKSVYGEFAGQTYPLIFKDQSPTERITNFLSADRLPNGPFSVEMWMVNHVNQPIGALITAKTKDVMESPSWLLGYYGRDLVFSLHAQNESYPRLLTASLKERGWKRYWLHVVATYDGQTARLFVNNKELGQMAIGPRHRTATKPEIELAGYLENEPYMEIANLVKNVRIYDQAISTQTIADNFKAFQDQIEQGHLFQNLFHFTAGPYLHMVTENSINIAWESSQVPVKAVVNYGTKLPLTKSMSIPVAGMKDGIQTISLTDLTPNTPYFYEIELCNAENTSIKSGILTFATANPAPHPFTFAVIGDTEARPHVNFKVAALIWDERPNFVVNLGDLTDGGKAPHKFEWTHEYFTGITPLASRIPFFPVAGNGESDLYWYKKYHKLPEPEGYYTFTYGDAQFFMLDSNRKEAFAPGGKQYEWLEAQLKASTATWKFVCHHHAPYSSDENDYGNSWEEPSDLGDLRVRKIVPLYEKYGVDIVFFGHLHTYQRTLPILENRIDRRNGVIYLQGGGGGGNLEDFTPTRSWFSAKTYRGHHYFTISIQENELLMKMYDSDGNMKDFMEIEK